MNLRNCRANFGRDQRWNSLLNSYKLSRSSINQKKAVSLYSNSVSSLSSSLLKTPLPSGNCSTFRVTETTWGTRMSHNQWSTLQKYYQGGFCQPRWYMRLFLPSFKIRPSKQFTWPFIVFWLCSKLTRASSSKSKSTPRKWSKTNRASTACRTSSKQYLPKFWWTKRFSHNFTITRGASSSWKSWNPSWGIRLNLYTQWTLWQKQ